MSTSLALGLIVLVLTYASIRCFFLPSLPKIHGPRSSSIVLGNLLDIFQRSVGQTDFEWQRLYGDVVRFKSVFGEDQLLIADPKALHRMFNTAAYNYPKEPNIRTISRVINGKGVLWAEGEDHKRHRRILLPAFGSPECKAFLGIFKDYAESVCTKWMEIIENSTDQKAVIDIRTWISHGTLDAIGQAGFNVRFETLQNNEHPLAKVYKNIFHDIFGRPTAQQIFAQAASMYIPTWILELIKGYGWSPRLQRMREVEKIATGVAKQLVQEMAESLLAGKGSRDVFSLLVKANMDADAKNKLTEEELLSQMRTILLAGHETTANTISWILLEVARYPQVQSRMRAEIREMETTMRARGDAQFTVADFEAMDYMTAVIKEGLRYHPVLPHIHRIADRDDILPLARPIITESGKLMTEILVPKGTRIVASIAAYNRKKELWGEDAHEFNPDRWLDGVAGSTKSVQIGVHSNLMTFSSGARACLGWRFALLEIQAFLVELVGRFELTMTPQAEKADRGAGIMMMPVIEDGSDSQLPLAVSIAMREDDSGA